MKTRINLFNAQLLPPQPRLTLPRLLAVAALLLILLIAVTAVSQWRLDQQQQRLQAEQQRQQQLSQQLALRASELAALQPSLALQNQIKQQQQQLQGLEQIAQLLQQDKFLIEPGYAKLMQDLSASADKQVWLQQFEFANNYLLISGLAQNAAAVPTWIDRLGSRPSLQGRPIRNLLIEGDEQGPVRFTASHQVTAAVSEASQ
ncbi:PilN domain-containing protein [Ferrimonas senticii]|uniref:PilN domain-containing protein n=1 Tax=Ferrimonas senticii TaxID=394566 RepID=UPI00040B1AAA|nr:PilN domain-containing protein [Ferrimonas senticii]